MAAVLCACCAAQATLVPAVPTVTVVASDFSTGTAGWVSAGNGAGNAQSHASGGDPGGYLSVADVSPGWAYFSAPASYRHAALADGVLSFALAATSDASHPILGDVRVALVGKDAGGHTLTLVGELAGTRPGAAWSQYSFGFGAGSADVFRVQDATEAYSSFNARPTAAQWALVMGSLTEMLIGADYSAAFGGANGTEEAWLDNVRYEATFLPQEDAPGGEGGGSGGDHKVPEPGGAALLLSGLGLLALARRLWAPRPIP